MLRLIYIILVVRSVIFRSTLACEAAKRGNHAKVIEKRDHIGGNIYTKKIDGIDVHMYGAHIFHTRMKDIWDYINQFATFNNFVNSPVANYHGHLYNTLVKGYTEKQWGRSAKDLPAFIIRRLPFHFTYNNNYFNDPYQGIPIGGYTQIIQKMLKSPLITVKCNADFFNHKQEYLYAGYDKIIYTGMIDQFFNIIMVFWLLQF